MTVFPASPFYVAIYVCHLTTEASQLETAVHSIAWFRHFGGEPSPSDHSLAKSIRELKVARYSFSGSIPPKFEHKLRRHKQRFGKIATTVVLDEDENLFLSGLQRHRSCHSNEMTLFPILLAAVYLGTGNCSSKIIHGSFFVQ